MVKFISNAGALAKALRLVASARSSKWRGPPPGRPSAF
jgi:hypothetical protein